MKYRCFSDVSERTLLYQFPDLSFDADNCVELETPEQIAAATALGASEEPEPPKPNSSTGMDGFQDLAAYGSRSRADLMPGYTPTIDTPFFGVKRRATRGQPL